MTSPRQWFHEKPARNAGTVPLVLCAWSTKLKGDHNMSKRVSLTHRKSNSCCVLTILLLACCFVLPAAAVLAIDHPTSNPYEARPVPPDGNLPYRIIPTPGGILIERDIMVAMPDGVKLACNIFRPDKPGKFPVILAMTPYGKDQTPPVFNPDGSYLPATYGPYRREGLRARRRCRPNENIDAHPLGRP